MNKGQKKDETGTGRNGETETLWIADLKNKMGDGGGRRSGDIMDCGLGIVCSRAHSVKCGASILSSNC
jgi:hypothetical protein